MGSSNSKASAKLESRQEAIRRRGVLIPPLFALAKTSNHDTATASANSHHQSFNGVFSMSSQDQLPLHPSLVDYLVASHVGHGILWDFLTPGIWISASAGPGNNVRASLPMVRPTTPTTKLNHRGEIAFLMTPFTKEGPRVEVRAGTDAPTMQVRADQSFSKPGFGSCGLVGNVNTHGAGYVGGNLNFSIYREQTTTTNSDNYLQKEQFYKVDDDGETLGKINIQVGSWVPFRPSTTFSITPTPNLKTNSAPNIVEHRQNNRPLPISNNGIQWSPNVHGYFAINMLGSTTAVEAKWNRQTDEVETKKYFSMLLNGVVNQNGNTSTNNFRTSAPPAPPLWLTMTSNSQATTINVSQILTFDRLNFNVTEFQQRAPLVRNTLGWSVQVEKSNYNNDVQQEHESAMISAGLVWQVNRGLALKVVGNSRPQQTQQFECTYGLILKRWKRPRMTCSLLNRYDFHSQKSSFVGIGLELDTDASPIFYGEQQQYYQTGDDGHYHVPSEVPDTKAALP